MVIYNNVSSGKYAYLIDIAVPGDGRMAARFQEQMQKYTDLKFELRKMCNNQCLWSLFYPILSYHLTEVAWSVNMLIGVVTPPGSVHSSSAHP